MERVFPARAGMNPVLPMQVPTCSCVPRTRGMNLLRERSNVSADYLLGLTDDPTPAAELSRRLAVATGRA